MCKSESPKPGGDAGEALRFKLLKAAIFILLPLVTGLVTAIVVLQ